MAMDIRITQIVSAFCGLAVGVALGVWLNTQRHGDEPIYSIDATIFLQLPRDQLEDFSNGMPTADGKLKSVGNILGGTELTTVRHAGHCGSVREIEQYIRDFLQSDRYICYEARYLN